MAPTRLPSLWEALPAAVRRQAGCIEWVESRDHPYEPPNSAGASGAFQFEPATWQFYARPLGITQPQAFEATLSEQRNVLARYWRLNGGFLPAWSGDPCA